MKLFTKEINDKLFKQYPLGADLSKQKVVAKIFNPYGNGRWFLLNSDPNDPNYMWAIVEMGGNVEMGSVSRSELEGIKLTPFRLGLERDLGFRPINAEELYKGLLEGKFYKRGGMVVTKIADIPNFNQRLEEGKITYRGLGMGKLSNDFYDLAGEGGTRIKVDGKEYYITNSEFSTFSRGSDGKMRIRFDAPYRRGYEEGGYMAGGGEVKWQDVNVGDNARVKSENKMGVIFSTYGRKFNLRFVDGSEKTYDASDLEFFKDEEYAHGGDVEEGNLDMVKNQVIQVEHHAKELMETLKSNPQVDAWVVAKMDRATSNLSDITHYLEGEKKSFAEGVEKEEKFTFFGTTENGWYVKDNESKKMVSPIGRMVWETKEDAINDIKENKFRYAEGGMMDEGGTLSHYSVNIDLENGEFVRDLKFNTIDKAKEIYKKYSKSMEYKGDMIEDIQLKKVLKNGEYETVKAAGSDSWSTAEDEYADGGMMAKGGSLNTYKLRAEGLNDFLSFLQTGMYMRMKSFTIEPIGVPDVVVSFVTDASLSEIKSKLKEVTDSHVMLETIKPINEYTGERDRMMAKGGKTTFNDKVKSITEKLLKKKKVSPKVQKDYGKTFNKKEAIDSAKRIAGAMRKKEMAKKKN
jgi:hypothetical protein